MKHIHFWQAGDIKNRNNEKVFFTSKNRNLDNYRFIRNDICSFVSIPIDIYKKHFKFEHSTWIYRTDLTYKELCNIDDVKINIETT